MSTDRTAGIKWDAEPLTSIPRARAWGKQRGVMHAKGCPCATCADLRASAAAQLLRKIPRLSEILGERVPWNLQTWALRGLYGRFLALREKLIAEVQAGRLTWPPSDAPPEAREDPAPVPGRPRDFLF